MDDDLRLQLADAILGLLRPEVEAMITARVEARLPEPSPWLTVEEAAEYLKISSSAVRQRVYAGTLTCHYDSGGKMRFRREDLDATLYRYG